MSGEGGACGMLLELAMRRGAAAALVVPVVVVALAVRFVSRGVASAAFEGSFAAAGSSLGARVLRVACAVRGSLVGSLVPRCRLRHAVSASSLRPFVPPPGGGFPSILGVDMVSRRSTGS